MAYSGWLVKVGDFIIDSKKYIKAESYSAYANMQDLDLWTDANGYVHRNAVELKAMKSFGKKHRGNQAGNERH